MHPPLVTSAHRRLTFESGEPAAARRGLDFLRRTLTQWRPGTDRAVLDDVALVAAELLANAVDHTDGPTAMDLILDTRGGRLRICVADSSPAEPRILAVLEGQPHHRGLRIVDHIAEAWGHHGNGEGKTVWADLCLA
ncbi:ATP-binding protein [Kitasatospora sp. NPDC051914]|uniref:ATP-binding protein n=1 Tax=Kitasatospora sp. NPDC051914 TaxID=3154945 RepID=UPI0034317BFF